MAMSGVALIAAERYRHIHSEGFTPEHDVGHERELAQAAACYALRNGVGGSHLDMYPTGRPRLWPWEQAFWRPKDKKRDLIRAGALIAAALDAIIAAEPAAEILPSDGLKR